ncbi:MAG: inorganic pyrophosphatase [Verrucomicrobiota bacterium]|nr:inorganic pyrophosphatase [Verrucomicrobiota bacterium]MEC8753321.1 inorganic pyrophosphatase [Verrucomicrobiota bacterium]|tara:strand:- start:608 stop:1216 length:609 start_codon:yes stop_codon:yes gene_type:complete
MSFPETFYRWRPHPWHGIDIGKNAPEIVNAFIEMTPLCSVKYEVDKLTGYLKVDRPQLTSSLTPDLYGFIPQTICGSRVTKLSPKAKRGDEDPLDICVITERPINKSEIIVKARVIGGIQMVDRNEADDKIIAVLDNDKFWNKVEDIEDMSEALVDRFKHYFETYKLSPGHERDVRITEIYGKKHARKVIKASMEDYNENYG